MQLGFVVLSVSALLSGHLVGAAVDSGGTWGRREGTEERAAGVKPSRCSVGWCCTCGAYFNENKGFGGIAHQEFAQDLFVY